LFHNNFPGNPVRTFTGAAARPVKRRTADASGEHKRSLHFPSLIGIISSTMDGTRSYVVGLDGGGTKTAIQFADSQGKVLAESVGGPTNFQISGVDGAAKTIVDLIETCCHTVGCASSQIGSVVAGLTGAGRTSDQQRMSEGIRAYAQKRSVYLRDLAVESDARIAMEGAFLGDAGIIVIAGTGSIVYGKDKQGVMHRAGGWGRLIRDEGSGYRIGQDGIRAVARMIDGVSDKTSLAGMVGDEFGLRTQEEIIKAVYKDGFDLASLAPLVIRAAARRDRIAVEILASAAAEVVGMVHAVAVPLKRSAGHPRARIPLVFVGSLLDSDNIYSAKVRALIRKDLKSIIIQKPIASPVRGAVLMALARMKKGVRATEHASAV